MLLMIDNYDSFTFNLVQYFGELGEEVTVIRNDAKSVAEIAAMRPDRIVISPGPCTPNEAGVSLQVLHDLAGTVPIRHRGEGVFAGVPDGFEATRYHSLVVRRETLPDTLEITAWTEDAEGGIDEIMGLRHRSLPVEGVQFHPESILTQHGHDLLRNFLQR